MKYVEIYKLENDGNQTVVATFRLVGDVVECDGNKIFVANLTKHGIRNYQIESDTALFPKDGLLFLENLKFMFKSGYLNASDILEK